MVGALLDSERAGVYFSASRIAGLIQFGTVAIQQIAGPMIAAFYADGRLRDLQRTLSLSALGASVFAIPSGILLIVFSGPILGVFGVAFVDGEAVLRILTASQAINALTGMTGLVMTMTGHQAIASRVIGICAVANVGLNGLFIPAFGMEGAAFATLATTIAWNLLLVYYAWARLGLWTLPWLRG